VIVYSAIASLDGYIEDPAGKFGWAMPDHELHAFVNEQERAVGTYLYGRRMYETMVAWETMEGGGVIAEYADIWRAAEKIVYSRTLSEPRSARTRIEHHFDPEEVRRLKASADRDISVGGPELAGQAIAAGLVDEIHLYLFPILVGGGKRALPEGVRVDLELKDERRFESGAVHLHYRAAD
jgi:dihydrofolate reductase